MIDDFKPPVSRKKPKVIHPLPKASFKPLPKLDEDDVLAEPIADQSVSTDVSADTSVSATSNDATPTKTASGVVASHPKKAKRFSKLHLSWPPTRRQSIILATVIVLLLAGGADAWAQLNRDVKVTPSATGKHLATKPKVVLPTTVASLLSGLQVDPSVNQRPVTGVMIENSPDARPQSGLDQASVVFEAIAEGGITRFLTLFQDTQPDYLGPVRSARPYYVQWCMGFDCSLAHVGGSPEALQDIKDWNTKNLDQFANSGSFDRISSRYAPHNVYTSIDRLNQLETSRGYGASSFTGFSRKADVPYKAPAATTTSSTTTKTKTPQPAADTRTPASTIDMAISGYYYNTHYDYDAATNTYKRSEGGTPHMSLHKDGSQVQIAPKVVIAMVMQYGLEADDHHSQYNVIGSGQAFIFQDGTVTTGTWNKTDMKSQVSFTDANGKAIQLDAGQTWLTALSAANQVTYK